MTTSLTQAALKFPHGNEEDAELRMERAGMIGGAIAQLPNGSSFVVNFIDCKHIEEEIELAHQKGLAFFARPGLMIVSRTSSWISTLAVCWAASQDYFGQLRPIPYQMESCNVTSITYGSGIEAIILKEASDRGYLENVDVGLGDGRHFNIAFIVPMRLSREIELDCPNGRPFYIEPGLIVVRDIAVNILSMTIHDLAKQGYFSHLMTRK